MSYNEKGAPGNPGTPCLFVFYTSYRITVISPFTTLTGPPINFL
jgi:hypothetical protein